MINFKNITTYRALTIIFFMFLGYAFVDVYFKIKEHKKYDMDKILIDIKKRYPEARLTFQNIRVEDDKLKRTHTVESGLPDTYYESVYLRIRDNRLQRDVGCNWILSFTPLFIIFLFFNSAPITDLKKVKWVICISLLVSLIVYVYVFVGDNEDPYLTKYISAYEFKNGITSLLSEIDLNNYKKED